MVAPSICKGVRCLGLLCLGLLCLGLLCLGLLCLGGGSLPERVYSSIADSISRLGKLA